MPILVRPIAPAPFSTVYDHRERFVGEWTHGAVFYQDALACRQCQFPDTAGRYREFENGGAHRATTHCSFISEIQGVTRKFPARGNREILLGEQGTEDRRLVSRQAGNKDPLQENRTLSMRSCTTKRVSTGRCESKRPAANFRSISRIKPSNCDYGIDRSHSSMSSRQSTRRRTMTGRSAAPFRPSRSPMRLCCKAARARTRRPCRKRVRPVASAALDRALVCRPGQSVVCHQKRRRTKPGQVVVCQKHSRHGEIKTKTKEGALC